MNFTTIYQIVTMCQCINECLMITPFYIFRHLFSRICSFPPLHLCVALNKSLSIINKRNNTSLIFSIIYCIHCAATFS